MHYMDDAWSYETDPMLVYYAPHDSWFPRKQVTLLQLYNDLGLPYDKKKQVFGRSLDIIGLYVDSRHMTISMSDMSQADLVTAVRNMLSYYLWLPYYMATVSLFMAAIQWQLYCYALYIVFRSPVGFCGWSVAI